MSSHPTSDAETASPIPSDLRELYAQLAPTAIGCLFVGDLALVPVDEFLLGGSRVWIVDRWGSRSGQAVAECLLREEGGCYVCRVCKRPGSGETICGSFVPPPHPDAPVCASFALGGKPPRCVSFTAGSQTKLLVADGTMGPAACFATRVEDLVARASTPREALTLALAACRRCESVRGPLDLPRESLEFVVSVLLPAEMDEPCFDRLYNAAKRRFGTRVDDPEVEPLLFRLRANLLRMRIDGHLREIHRLVNRSRGHVYLAAESVVHDKHENNWALMPEIAATFELIHRYFTFELGRLPPASILRHARDAEGRLRVLGSAVLKPRKRVLTPPETRCALQGDDA